MVEPSFLALTSTPSMAPSSAEDTWPFSAASAAVAAEPTPTIAKPAARIAAAGNAKRVVRMSTSLKSRCIIANDVTIDTGLITKLASCLPCPGAKEQHASIALLETPIRDLEPLGEPDVGKALGVVDELVHHLGPVGHAGYERVHVERAELRRALLALPIEIVELILHDLQQVARRAQRAVGRVVVAAGHVVGDHHDLAAARLDRIGHVAVERVRPPDEAALLGDQV